MDLNQTAEMVLGLQQQMNGMAAMVTADGDNAWMMTSTALVYLMTPALAFFYGGMVDKKNVLGTLFLSFLCMGIVTVQWLLFGFDLAFGPSTSTARQFGGGGHRYEAINFGGMENPEYSTTLPFYTFVMFQCAFAVITPALISGSVVNKMKLSTFCVFVFVWTTLVYDVLAFWVWNPQGWLHKLGALDWAGGTVIHIASGFSGLTCAMMIGLETGDGSEEAQPAFTVLGAGMLWFGWLGFNAGSATNAGPLAALSFLNTNAAAASSLVTWAALEYLHLGRPSVVGSCNGAIVGLVVITPAAGFVRPGWALFMGIVGTAIVYVALLGKRRFLHKIDDPLDVFTCHGIGGLAGALLTGLFSEVQYYPGGSSGVQGAFYGNGELFANQIAAVVTAISYSVLMTFAICLVLKYTMGLNVSALENVLGMDAGAPSAAASKEAREKEKHKRNVVMRAIEMFSVGAPASKLTPQEEAVLHDVFALFDIKGEGKITVDQFEKALSSVGLSRPRSEIMALVAENDTDKSGAIDFREFKNMFLVSRDEARKSLVPGRSDVAIEFHDGQAQ